MANKEYKISNGVAAKIIRTEFAVTGGRTGKLQGQTLTITGVIRDENGAAVSFLLTDATGRRWLVYATDGKCKLTGALALPCKKGSIEWDVVYSAGIRVITIEKI